MEFARTINFWIWKKGKWVKGRGLVSVALLCARPVCRNKPHKPARYNRKKYCSRKCRYKHARKLGIGRGKFPDGYEKSQDDIAPLLSVKALDV